MLDAGGSTAKLALVVVGGFCLFVGWCFLFFRRNLHIIWVFRDAHYIESAFMWVFEHLASVSHRLGQNIRIRTV